MALQFWQQYSKLTALQPPTGMILWLIGDNALYDGSNYIYKVPDSSLNIDALQSIAINQPLYVANALNGHATMRFDGDNDFLKCANFDIASNKMTIFVVSNSEAGAGGKFILASGAYGSNGSYYIYYEMSFLAMQSDYQGTLQVYRRSPDNSIIQSKNYLFSFINDMSTDPDTQKIYINKNEVTYKFPINNNNTVSFAQNDLYIGTFSALSFYLKGDIAELIIYNSALSDIDRGIVETYLMTKYAL